MKRYNFNPEGYGYYIDSEIELSEEELDKIQKIIRSFPHALKSKESINRFLEFTPNETPKYILAITANAFDSCGNTMLGVTCEYGYSVDAVQTLINMGANLDTPDHNMNKLALHWAINNKKSFGEPGSVEAVAVVECLLQNGAETDIRCYQNKTPLEYARSRGFTAAADLIERYSNKRSKNKSEIASSSVLATNSLFSANITNAKEIYCEFKPGFLGPHR
ncbi:ankyrin repeat domain-containing protein [Legionella clemsonensis]|uniref:Ankyrin repeats (3 copies) n=1 Tax=Legionella clemsonensis TaxID=1867846 RepID=A0A222P4P8_9GAMM|nr:ankyrin repeat domain-containing protein [Legionella clemsonensis]ASQ46834.1 Ankyrin repeats (3 copies) [Legionella clemsonensis]